MIALVQPGRITGTNSPVSRDSWFRRRSWSAAVAEAFFARLARSRDPRKKAQYLRIQAFELHAAGNPELTRAALDLLNIHLEEFSDPYEITQAHLLAAQCHAQLHQQQEAIRHFRLSLNASEQTPNLDPGTTLIFPWYIVSEGLTDLYEDAESLVARAHIAFPVQRFKAAAIRALIASFREDRAAAACFASEAIEAAAKTKSAFRHHESLGLVGHEYAETLGHLRRIASRQ